MGQWTRFELILLAACLAVNGFMLWTTAGYPERVEIARRTPAPEGTRYLDACDGRPTDRLGDTSVDRPDECLADYPGEFARGVALGFSITLFLFANLLYLSFRLWRTRKSAG